MMIVDVEDRDPTSRPACLLSGNGGIVEIAIAAAIITTAMVAGRPAQGKAGRAIA